MSHILAGLLGAAAMSVTFGAVQFASGSSLSGPQAVVAGHAQSDAVNRAVKADRAAVAPRTAAGRTISVAPAGLDATSVLVRIPATINPVRATNAASTKLQTPAQIRRASNFGCEPVVSGLTEIARTLAPGRCIS